MVKAFFKRITKTIAEAYDPDREARIQELADRFYSGLRKDRQGFSLQKNIAGLDISKSDVRMAAKAAYRRLLETVWKDGVLTTQEHEVLKWVPKCLELPQEDSVAIEQEYAVEQFSDALAAAFEDGSLSDEGYMRMEHIASAVGTNAAVMTRRHFRKEAEAFLRGKFLYAAELGEFRVEQWDDLLAVCFRLGLSQDELTTLLSSSAKQYVEHVLADAKADGVLSDEERSHIEWLLTTLAIDRRFCEYVRREMHDFEILTNIADGRLPSIAAPQGVELRAGEIVHAYSPANLIVTRNLKSGPTQQAHHGFVLLLDSRAIFQGETMAQSINYRNIIALGGDERAIQFQLNRKPVWSLQLGRNSPWFLLMFRKAVSLANQTSTASSEGAPSRHISREVRQRVWQRYGGQCVDCGARDYLEFDHIIPVAKGGSNSDGNIQLLCRRCNLKKSDHI